MTHMLPEDAAEFASYERHVKLYGSPMLTIAESLANWSKANPAQGSLSKMQAIYSNEARRENRRLNRMKQLLSDLHCHVLALSVTDEAKEFKRLLIRLEREL